MDSMNLLPVETGSSGFGTGTAAALGAFVGSWVGNGGFGYGGRNAAVEVASDAAVLEAINGVGTTVLQGQAQSNMIAAQGFAGLNNVVQSGDAGVTAAVNQSSFQNLNALTQGFAGLNTAIVSSSNDNRFATQAGFNSLQLQMAQCCCETQKTIMGEGAATRSLIDKYAYESLQTQLCDAKSKISSLESQNYLQASQAAQTQQIIQTVLAHLNTK